MTRTATALLAALIAGGSLTALAIGDPGPPEMPDPALTPGVIASTDLADICARPGGASYSRRHRRWDRKAETLAKYGLPIGDARLYEDDDRVPVCAGGDNLSPLNHWPMPWSAARIKDELEASVCRDICHGKLSVAAGQAIFLGDWRGSLATYPERKR